MAMDRVLTVFPERTVRPPAGFDRLLVAQGVLDRCAKLAEHSDEPGRITRLFLGQGVRGAHGLLRRWYAHAGLPTRIDSAGNLIAHRRAERATHQTRTLLLGSHIDTVPNSGPFDGTLGLMVALATIEALADVALPFHLDLVAFSEEEGVRFARPYLGSRAVAGRFEESDLSLRDASGVSLRAAIESYGLDPSRMSEAAYDPGKTAGYFEVHLEQGPLLDSVNKPVGVVGGVQGQSRVMLRFSGDTGHAGTTPMNQRRDALVAAAKLITEVEDYGRSVEHLRSTCGFCKVWPNVRNVIPGTVELSLDVRHALDEIRRAAVDALLETAERIASHHGCTLELLERSSQKAVNVDPQLTAQLTHAVAAVTGGDPFELPSGAGHDAVIVSELCPVAMLFVRHPGGLSHRPDETVTLEDVAIAVDASVRFVLLMAEQEKR